jgi:hypothetical protein
MDPEIPRPSEPGLGRLLRRRARGRRMSRSYQGKEFKSWGEYAPRTLQTTGDHSSASRWGYLIVFFGALLIVPAFFGLAKLSSPAFDGASVMWRLGWFLNFMAPYLAIVAPILLGLVGYSALSKWRLKRQIREDIREN